LEENQNVQVIVVHQTMFQQRNLPQELSVFSARPSERRENSDKRQRRPQTMMLKPNYPRRLSYTNALLPNIADVLLVSLES
jgi:hypothetical protein